MFDDTPLRMEAIRVLQPMCEKATEAALAHYLKYAGEPLTPVSLHPPYDVVHAVLDVNLSRRATQALALLVWDKHWSIEKISEWFSAEGAAAMLRPYEALACNGVVLALTGVLASATRDTDSDSQSPQKQEIP